MSELNEHMIELTIEALTGTVYDLCVSPFETILGIKMKIQRLEGIPVYQQQLVHGNTELHDEFCLEEYSIGSGAQLKLLLAMRGGPIHAHRVELEDPTLLEIAEVLESHELDHKYTVMLLRADGDGMDMADLVQVVADESPGHVSPIPQTTSSDQETTSSIALSKVTRTKMLDLMDRLKSRKPTSQACGGSSSHSGTQLQRRRTTKLLIVDSRSSSHLLHSSAPSPVTPHPSGATPTNTNNQQSTVHRKLVFPAESEDNSSSRVGEQVSHHHIMTTSELDKEHCTSHYEIPSHHHHHTTTATTTTTATPCSSHKFPDHSQNLAGYPHKQSDRQWRRRRRLRRPSCLQEKTTKHNRKDVGELVREMSQLALQGEREKPPSTINRTADNLPHLPSIATSSTTYHTTRNCRSQVPQLPPISIGHAPCLTGSGGRAQGRPHCACCGKKTGLASTYTCRCGGVFCSLHRYAESHNCSFDYKTQGRETIARGNPLVVAPKLPKI